MISDVCEASLRPQISYIISKRYTHLGCASLQCALVQIGLNLNVSAKFHVKTGN